MLKSKQSSHYLCYANWTDRQFDRNPNIIYQNILHANTEKNFSFGNSVLKDIILYSIFNKINFLLPPLPETPSTHRLTVNL